ncbi:MAG TPA: hypothetical protein VFH34_12000, partial [Anaerolineales bacterium]|nr:hypothetical protein [Anaerolineales bacterium]
KARLGDHLVRFVEVWNFNPFSGDYVPAKLSGRREVAKVIHLQRQPYHIRVPHADVGRTLEVPPHLRVGDADVVRLTLEVDDLGNLTPTAQIGGNVVSGQVVEIPNLYESHQVIAEARFDLAGMEVRPADLVSEALSPGNSVTFRWSVRPPDVGFYRGTIWLYLRFVDKQTSEESRKTVSAQIVKMEAVNFLGLSGEFARTAGVIGSVVGTILGFPFFEDIVKFALKRRNKAQP